MFDRCRSLAVDLCRGINSGLTGCCAIGAVAFLRTLYTEHEYEFNQTRR